MNRRELLTGAAALALYSQIENADALTAGQRATLLGSVSVPLYFGQVATKSGIANGLAGSKQLNSRSYHVATDDIDALKINLPNWYYNTGTFAETNSGGTFNYTAQIETAGGIVGQILWGGSATKAVASGGTTGLSDACVLSARITRGTGFWVRVWNNSSAGIVFNIGLASGPVSNQVDIANGECMEFAASGLSDRTGATGIFTSTNPAATGPILRPLEIVGMTRRPSAALFGTSRVWGAADSFSASGDLGTLARAWGANWGYTNVGCAGDTLTNFLAGNAKRIALAANASHVVLAPAINSLRAAGGNQSASATLAQLQTMMALFPGKRIILSTEPPNPASSDSFATLVNQTVNANQTEIAAYNNAIRAGVSGALGYFEVADGVESSRNSGKVKVDGTTFKYTPDGLHFNQFGSLAIQAGTDTSIIHLP